MKFHAPSTLDVVTSQRASYVVTVLFEWQPFLKFFRLLSTSIALSLDIHWTNPDLKAQMIKLTNSDVRERFLFCA